jgi:hypothetical protein
MDVSTLSGVVISSGIEVVIFILGALATAVAISPASISPAANTVNNRFVSYSFSAFISLVLTESDCRTSSGPKILLQGRLRCPAPLVILRFLTVATYRIALTLKACKLVI